MHLTQGMTSLRRLCVHHSNYFPRALIRCLKMRSAFWRGVALLKGSSSNLGGSQGPAVGPSNSSASTKGFSEVPKNVALLKPVIRQLIDKVNQHMIPSILAHIIKDCPKGFTPAQLERARYDIELLKHDQFERADALRVYLGELEDELTLINFLAGENKEQSS